MQTKEQVEEFLCGTACPNGHRYTLVLASIAKRALAEEMPAAYRLQFLQHLDKMADGQSWLTAEMIAAVEPMCDNGNDIAQEVRKLGPRALDAYAKFFSTFAVLNPSLVAALKMSPIYRAQVEYKATMETVL